MNVIETVQRIYTFFWESKLTIFFNNCRPFYMYMCFGVLNAFSDILGMNRVAKKFVPKVRNYDEHRFRSANNELDFLNTVITDDEN